MTEKRLNRREFMRLTGAGLALAAAGTSLNSGAANTRPPNLIVILADDIGAKELACYGNKNHNTPSLDRLAETGVRFETCYTAPICHPTRVMIMTGQYGCHNGVYTFAGRRGGPEPDSPAEDIGNTHITFAEMLKPKGYATALSGKWQLSGELPTLIRECGFDEYCMWAYAHNLPKGVEHTGGWEQPGKPARYWNPCIVKNGEYTPTKKEDYGPDLFNEFAIDFIKRHKDEPFFVYHTMCLTHGPHELTPDNKDAPDADKMSTPQRYKGVVDYMDKLVGRLVAALDE
ncbi:MAG: Sulfatase protein, partial [Candidatus Hydrogenedentes bacterium]|nr:Sulfatase protein [Candidatus Hydrogenedentota bacterium]